MNPLAQRTVKNITLSEVPKAAETLFSAFKGDPLMLWLCGSAQQYNAVAKKLFETWVNYCVRYGKAFRTENFEAVALRKKPGDTGFSMWRLYRSGMLKCPKILGKEGYKRLKMLDKLEEKAADENMGDKPYWYCWMLGTLANKQGQGYGGALMRKTFNLAEQEGVPCYLETATESALKVHSHCGYRELSHFDIPNSDISITCMLREV